MEHSPNATKHVQKIYVADTDQGGIVYHANYLRFMEAGRIEFLNAHGISYHDLHQSHISLSPVSLSIHYHASLRLEESCTVVTQLTSLKKVTLFFDQKIYLEDTLCTSAEVKLACINETTFKPCAIPDQVYSTLLPLCD